MNEFWWNFWSGGRYPKDQSIRFWWRSWSVSGSGRVLSSPQSIRGKLRLFGEVATWGSKGRKSRPKAESGGRVLGRGSDPPTHQPGGRGCKLPSGFRGCSRKRIWCILSVTEHFSTLLVENIAYDMSLHCTLGVKLNTLGEIPLKDVWIKPSLWIRSLGSEFFYCLAKTFLHRVPDKKMPHLFYDNFVFVLYKFGVFLSYGERKEDR